MWLRSFFFNMNKQKYSLVFYHLQEKKSSPIPLFENCWIALQKLGFFNRFLRQAIR